MNFHDELKINMHRYVRLVYRITRKFPKEEIFGSVSQFRRASLSVILNYIEGYARRTSDNCKTYQHFLNISYGSLKESKYLLYLSLEEEFISEADYLQGLSLCDKIGKMLWSLIK